MLYSRILRLLAEPYAEVTKGRKNCGADGCDLVVTDPLAPFIVRLKVSTYSGLVIALPVVLWQLWRFITPGLNPKEKRYAIPFILSSIVLFAWAGGRVADLPEGPRLPHQDRRGRHQHVLHRPTSTSPSSR